MHPINKIEKVIGKPYYLQGVRIGCTGVSNPLSEFRELSLSNYLGLVQTYALAYTYVLGRERSPDVFFPDFAVRGHLWPCLDAPGETRNLTHHKAYGIQCEAMSLKNPPNSVFVFKSKYCTFWIL